jgi:hypothetical protein
MCHHRALPAVAPAVDASTRNRGTAKTAGGLGESEHVEDAADASGEAATRIKKAIAERQALRGNADADRCDPAARG